MKWLMLRLLSWARSQQLAQQVLFTVMHQDAEYICQLLLVLLQQVLWPGLQRDSGSVPVRVVIGLVICHSPALNL
jgi:hypothetical protein